MKVLLQIFHSCLVDMDDFMFRIEAVVNKYKFWKYMIEEFGIVVAGHGSRDKEGVDEFHAAMELFRKNYPNSNITYGFLEFAKPTIDTAIRTNIQRGSKKVVMIPWILLAASHGKNDMPIELLSMKKEFPQVEFFYGSEMDLHPLYLKLMQERIIQAEAESNYLISRKDSLLVIVGRGTTDPDANSQVNKLARILEEGMGFGSSFVCFSGTANPLVSDGMIVASKMGFKRVIAIPFFILTGVLVKRIYEACDQAIVLNPEVEILKAGYLGVHSLTVKALYEKAKEAFEGKASMNCSLCKYRTQIVGYEDQVGMVQEAHHHHVRGGEQHSHTHKDHHSDQKPKYGPYQPHPIEIESFEFIKRSYPWKTVDKDIRFVTQRLVHTTGDFSIIPDLFFSENVMEKGMDAIHSKVKIITDVGMVKQGINKNTLRDLGIEVECFVHDHETKLISDANSITCSAAGIRRAWNKYQDDLILAIGDAPTAVFEVVRLIRENQWAPKLVVALPVGFIETEMCKTRLKECQEIPRISNQGTKGGSPWAAAVVNAILIQCLNQNAIK